jgi:hypothetical protein
MYAAAVGVVTLALLLPVAEAPAQAQAASTRAEGIWVRKDSAGSGGFGGLAASLPQALLTPEAAASRRGGGPGPARGAPQVWTAKPGEPLIVVERPCAGAAGGARGNGAGLISPDSVGVHIVEHKDEVIMAGERGGVRHIYTDGRPHPASARRVPAAAGYSVGRYEGNVLVVETIGFTPGAVPAGGQRTPETKLTERFAVAPDGLSMTITYTWEDPKIYQKPHVYSYHFDRLPPGSYAFEEWCDAGDPTEKYGITPPKQ